MKIKRKIIEIDQDLCDGCGQCVPSCAEGAIEIKDGKARLVSERYCDGLGACLGECPKGALRIVEREAEDFDEEAVHEYLAEKKAQEKGGVREPSMACGCPSTLVQTFGPQGTACQDANRPKEFSGSLLSHWPIQLRLVGPKAPFLKDAHLLIASDCTVAARPGFHQEFLPGRVLLMGCPKFDDVELYRERLRDILRENNVKSITCVVMEVPCCGGMPRVVAQAMKDAGGDVPFETKVIGIKGQLVGQK